MKMSRNIAAILPFTFDANILTRSITMATVRATTAVAGILRKANNGLTKRCFGAAASDEPLVKTSLYDLHKELGADMVPFAGYALPVLYKGENGGVMKEHLWCREEGKSALFDVSHMGQVGSLFSFEMMMSLFSLVSSFSQFTHIPRLYSRSAGTARIVLPFWKRLLSGILLDWQLAVAAFLSLPMKTEVSLTTRSSPMLVILFTW
jgi:hypothetical protein